MNFEISKEISSSFQANHSSLIITHLKQSIRVSKKHSIYNQLVSCLILFASLDIIQFYHSGFKNFFFYGLHWTNPSALHKRIFKVRYEIQIFTSIYKLFINFKEIKFQMLGMHSADKKDNTQNIYSGLLALFLCYLDPSPSLPSFELYQYLVINTTV